MNKKYINIGSMILRVEANWNATLCYCKRKGIHNLVDMDTIGKMTIDDVLPLAHACISEGERMDGKEFLMTESQLGEAMLPTDMTKFIRIYAEMTTPKITPSDNQQSDIVKKKR